jgi:hypothetical protein
MTRSRPEAPADTPRVRAPERALTALRPEDRARRATIAATAGSIVVTVGELEDHLAQLAPEERVRFAGREGRRALAREVLRGRLLAAEAERRGLAADPAVRVAERRALVEALLARDFDLARFETGEEDSRPRLPARRRAIVLFAPDRRAAERLRGAVEIGNVEAWLDLAGNHRELEGAPHAGGDLGWIAESPLPDEPPLAEPLRQALWELTEYGAPSAPIRVGGVWAIVVYGGYRDPEPVGPSPGQRAWERREHAIAQLVEALRAEHLRGIYPDRFISVPLPVREPEEEAWEP